MKTPESTLRLDKWLWAARFFKTRKLASDAVNGGKVHLNGQRTKPGKEVKIGSKMHISKDHYTWDITVLGIGAQRRPAKEAVLLYEESSESHEKRQTEVNKRRQEKQYVSDYNRKPNKRERRKIQRLKRK